MTTSFFLMVASSIALPALAVLALLLRRNLFTGVYKIIFLGLGLILLGYTVTDTIHEAGNELGFSEIILGVITAIITLFILAKFRHNHTHGQEEAGAKGIVISEAFHSLIDGAVIGATYLLSPLLGYAATIGIIIHELPKILGTLAIFRGLGLSIKKTIFYGILAQGGSPVAAILVYLLGKQITHEEFHALEIASISSLAVIVLWIITLEIRHHLQHRHNHDH
ncbi:MAG: zinc and cadmium transporter [Patescibacteria group bacterium]|nr:zinc and cadmium transporter [Patescibacteria group bacterium]